MTSQHFHVIPVQVDHRQHIQQQFAATVASPPREPIVKLPVVAFAATSVAEAGVDIGPSIFDQIACYQRCTESAHHVQWIIHIGWSLTCVALLVVSLVRESGKTFQFFSYWVLTLHAVFFGYMGVFFERHAHVIYRKIDVDRAEARWQSQPSYSWTSLAWSTLLLLSLFIFFMLGLLIKVDEEETSGQATGTAGDFVIQVLVHVVTLIVPLFIIGLPMFRVPFLHVTMLAVLIFILYNASLALFIQSDIFRVYGVSTHRHGELHAAIILGVWILILASFAIESAVSDLWHALWEPLWSHADWEATSEVFHSNNGHRVDFAQHHQHPQCREEAAVASERQPLLSSR